MENNYTEEQITLAKSIVSTLCQIMDKAEFVDKQPFTEYIDFFEPPYLNDIVFSTLRKMGFKIHILSEDPEMWEMAKRDRRTELRLKHSKPDNKFVIELPNPPMSRESVKKEMKQAEIQKVLDTLYHFIDKTYYADKQPYTQILHFFEPQWQNDLAFALLGKNGFKVHVLSEKPRMWEWAKCDTRNGFLCNGMTRDNKFVIELRHDMETWKRKFEDLSICERIEEYLQE